MVHIETFDVTVARGGETVGIERVVETGDIVVVIDDEAGLLDAILPLKQAEHLWAVLGEAIENAKMEKQRQTPPTPLRTHSTGKSPVAPFRRDN